MKQLIERLRSFGGFKNEMEICDEAATELEHITADRDSWLDQCNQRVADVLRIGVERDDLRFQLDASQAHESKLEDLEKERDALKNIKDEAWEAARGVRQRLEDENNSLKKFANLILEHWPEGDVDGGDLQDHAIACGLLKLKTPAPREPCGEGCTCAEYCDDDEFRNGSVMCYRKSEILK